MDTQDSPTDLDLYLTGNSDVADENIAGTLKLTTKDNEQTSPTPSNNQFAENCIVADTFPTVPVTSSNKLEVKDKDRSVIVKRKSANQVDKPNKPKNIVEEEEGGNMQQQPDNEGSTIEQNDKMEEDDVVVPVANSVVIVDSDQENDGLGNEGSSTSSNQTKPKPDENWGDDVYDSDDLKKMEDQVKNKIKNMAVTPSNETGNGNNSKKRKRITVEHSELAKSALESLGRANYMIKASDEIVSNVVKGTSIEQRIVKSTKDNENEDNNEISENGDNNDRQQQQHPIKKKAHVSASGESVYYMKRYNKNRRSAHKRKVNYSEDGEHDNESNATVDNENDNANENEGEGTSNGRGHDENNEGDDHVVEVEDDEEEEEEENDENIEAEGSDSGAESDEHNSPNEYKEDGWLEKSNCGENGDGEMAEVSWEDVSDNEDGNNKHGGGGDDDDENFNDDKDDHDGGYDDLVPEQDTDHLLVVPFSSKDKTQTTFNNSYNKILNSLREIIGPELYETFINRKFSTRLRDPSKEDYSLFRIFVVRSLERIIKRKLKEEGIVLPKTDIITIMENPELSDSPKSIYEIFIPIINGIRRQIVLSHSEMKPDDKGQVVITASKPYVPFWVKMTKAITVHETRVTLSSRFTKSKTPLYCAISGVELFVNDKVVIITLTGLGDDDIAQLSDFYIANNEVTMGIYNALKYIKQLYRIEQSEVDFKRDHLKMLITPLTTVGLTYGDVTNSEEMKELIRSMMYDPKFMVAWESIYLTFLTNIAVLEIALSTDIVINGELK